MRIVALTGAGVSTDSGIPDFRGPQGIWTLDPAAEKLYSLQAYRDDPAVRRRSWQTRLHHPAWRARPNRVHELLAAHTSTVITQNVDGLHQAAGSTEVLELHGSLHGTRCLSCGIVGDMREALQRVAAGEQDPDCEYCGGILKSTTVSFGEHLDQTLLRRARAAAHDADLLLVAGSSLRVQPAASLVGSSARLGVRVIICNAEPTRYDDKASEVFLGPVGETVPRVLEQALRQGITAVAE